MATKADILITAKDKASGVIKTVEDSLHGVADKGPMFAKGADEAREGMQGLIDAMREAGATAPEIQEALELTRAEMLEFGFAADEATGKIDKQAASLVRMPQYFAGYRGGWLNLITAVTMGASIFSLAHRVMEQFTEAIQEAVEANAHLTRQVEAASSIWDAYKRGMAESVIEMAGIGREAEDVLESLSRFSMIIEAIGMIIEQTGIPVLREYGILLKNLGEAFDEIGDKDNEVAEGAKRIADEYQRLIDQQIDKEYEDQSQAIFDASDSVGGYIIQTMSLLSAQGLLAGVLKEVGMEALAQGIALDYAARQADKARAMFERLMGTLEAISGVTDAVRGYVRDLGDAQDTYADRTEDILFRAGQAWESYAFRVGQAMAALNFRLTQAQDKFDFSWGQRQEKAQHAAASRAARAGAAAAAASARHHLRLETITQDHHDKLEDMEKKHQEEMRRFLQKAPWYLQREIRDYQKEKKALEAKGDKEGLAQLKKAFMERMRAIDPIYAEELERLEELQQDERDVEDREFNQRLKREKRQFAISRAQAAANAGIALADAQFALGQQNAAAIFAYEQWLKAQEFSQEQRLASMKFAYEQQAEATARALEEAEEDRKEALEQITEDFNKWAKDEMRREYMRWFRIGYQGLKGYYEGRGEEPPDRPTPKPPGGGGRKQMGMPYVPTTMPVTVHTGEAILRRDQAAAWRGGERGGEIIINFYGPVYMRTGQEVRRLATDISRELGRRAYVRR